MMWMLIFLLLQLLVGGVRFIQGSCKRARVRLITLPTATIDLWFDSKQHILV